MTEQTFQTKARNEYIYSNFLKKKKKKTKEKRFSNERKKIFKLARAPHLTPL